MARIFHPLLFLLARCTRHELIRTIELLRAELEMTRKRVPQKHIVLSADEKERLIMLGQELGPAIKQTLSIVSYGTYLRWLRDRREGKPVKKQGRPRKAEQLRQLIVRMGKETGWGYTRIMGELKKLGIKPPSRGTVRNILKEHKLDPGPDRGPDSWSEFLKRHAETLWQCDFFSKRIWTKYGPRHYFALVFIHVASRRVFVTESCRKPDADWVRSQAEAFVKHTEEVNLPVGQVLRDRDSKFSKAFDNVFMERQITVKRIAFRAPNMQAYVERWVQSLKQECLDWFIVFGKQHFDHLISEYVEHYLTERPHQAVGNVPLVGEFGERVEAEPDGVVCRTRVGGLLRHYERRAA